jgi:hypothetical protein
MLKGQVQQYFQFYMLFKQPDSISKIAPRLVQDRKLAREILEAIFVFRKDANECLRARNEERLLSFQWVVQQTII